MDFFEAMNEMKNGKKIRLISWHEKSYIGVQEENVKIFGKNKVKYTVLSQDLQEVPPSASFTTFLMGEWVVVECD